MSSQSPAPAWSCSEVQVNLSLYLYGELDFAGEEALERHLDSCPMCQLAFAREKRWHTTVNGRSVEVPRDVLDGCRAHLFESVRRERAAENVFTPKRWPVGTFGERLSSWLASWGPRATQWSGRIALASFFVFCGMLLSRWVDGALPGASGFQVMSLLGGGESKVRDIQADSAGRIRIVVDRLEQRQVVGAASDTAIRRLLVEAARNSADPVLRIDSVELLKGERSGDVRDALLACVRNDANAAVRLKALDALRRFSDEPATRDALISVLESDPDSAVRSRAIDVLLPPRAQVQVSPNLIRALEGVSQSDSENDYLRGRCLQVLRALDASGFDAGVY